MDHREKLLVLVDGYCGHTHRSEARVSTVVLNGGHRIKSIRGGGSFTVATYERAMAWFSDHWPAGLAWPEGVERPPQQKKGNAA